MDENGRKRLSLAGIAVKDGKVLVALRKPGTSIGESWEFPGGKSEEGESPGQTLIREYLEEFDADIEVGEKVCSGSFRNREKEYILAGYLITLKSDLTLKEHSALKWVTPGELDGLTMAVSDRQIAECVKKILSDTGNT